MNTWRADLHIHSRFSRATSKQLTVPNLAAWAGAKGIDVLATGDFTHPVWRQELRDALEFDDESGFYKLKEPLDDATIEREVPSRAGVPLKSPRFVLESEISSIYKKNGKVRKVHTLVYMPDFDAAEKLCTRLAAIGNLNSDGRPILGLDIHHLLEMVLEIPGAYLIPAHIWTPWFSLFGSKSGFDSLEEAFEDLTPYLFAAETGLSSDPDMNRCWSHLDHLVLTSSSDAHSGENLAREATLFSGAPSYTGMFDALHKKNDQYAGTLEFFPDEGKYHLDGHRACNVVLDPLECMKLNNICPVCGKPLTVGVLHRVLDLADRTAPPEPGKNFRSLIPLPEILGELLHCGPKTRKVQNKLADIAPRFGSELDLLMDTPLSDVSAYWPELGEALRRMRAGEVKRKAGFDGEYGVIHLFEPEENGPSLLEKVPAARRNPLKDQGSLLGGLAAMQEKRAAEAKKEAEKAAAPAEAPLPEAPKTKIRRRKTSRQASLTRPAFSAAQEKALSAGLHPSRPVLVLAGPGAGKTRTLAGRVLHLLEEGTNPADIAAVTFTRRAAGELKERLELFIHDAGLKAEAPECDTLHALALRHWQGEEPLLLPEEAARKAFASSQPQWDAKAAARAWDAFSLARERLTEQELPADTLAAATAYRAWKKQRSLADYTDLLEQWLEDLKNGLQRAPWKHLLVDEAQDLSPLQLALLHALLPADGAGFFGIGDPDQAIYAFRGADSHILRSLGALWPELETHTLAESYRAAQAVLDAARSSLLKAPDGEAACGQLKGLAGRSATLQWLNAPTQDFENNWVAGRIAYLLGGTSHQQADLHEELAGCHLASGSCSPGDIAVLVRLKALMEPLRAALEAHGIPCAVPEADAFWTDPDVDMLIGAALLHLGSEDGELHSLPADNESAAYLAAMPEELWNDGPRALLHALEGRAKVRKAAALMAGKDDNPLPAGLKKLSAPLFTEALPFRMLEKTYMEAGRDWKKTLADIALLKELDMTKAKAERVQIMTMHAAKGLEFKAVFLPCLEEGLLPFFGPKRDDDASAEDRDEALREEARLLYVAITRAAEAVFASYSKERRFHGKAEKHAPSSLFAPELFRAIVPHKCVRRKASQLSFG